MLPRLRNSLDFFPSPRKDKPGLVIRDPLQYTDATLIVPTAITSSLNFFDGEHSERDLRDHLFKIAPPEDVPRLAKHLAETLSKANFLDDEAFAQKKHAAEQAFAAAPVRTATHTGEGGYPAAPEELTRTFNRYLRSDPTPAASNNIVAIAAPHVSPYGGVDSYRAAYSALTPEHADRTFIVLGTSHYGAPDRFGLTRKPFSTPLGETIPVTGLVGEIARGAGNGAILEDYFHSIEHSIEFQVVFLQHLFGPKIRVVPILCGAFLNAMLSGGLPEDTESVHRMFGTLGEIAAREGSRLIWVLGVDMAHMGARYQDPFEATAGKGIMNEVEGRDRARIACVAAGDSRGFWDLVKENRDDLKWCGTSPIYTFLKALPHARGELLHYQQWNIDPDSVVSFAGMRFL